jgi:DNA-binding LacI/PurR family transcriptional regulator
VAFDGIVACSDVFAMSAVQALAERGLRVPADCAIVGYDDIPLASLTTPPLTTVRQNCRDGARLLVANLMRAIARERPSSTVLPTELIVRASSQRERYGLGSDVTVKPAQTTSRAPRPARISRV